MSQSSAALISHRVNALAYVSLTRRNELVVEELTEQGELDLLVRIGSAVSGEARFFGVIRRGTAKMLTPDDASRELNGYFRSAKSRAPVQYPFPVIGLIFSMETDQGFFAWRSKPLLRDRNRPAIELQEPLHCGEFTKSALDEVIKRTNEWYEALYSLLAPSRSSGV